MKRAVREWLYMRQSGTCAYCGKSCTLAEFNTDHIVPKSKADNPGWKPKWVDGLGYLVGK